MRRAASFVTLGVAVCLALGSGVVKTLVVVGVLYCAEICSANSWWQAVLLGCWC